MHVNFIPIRSADQVNLGKLPFHFPMRNAVTVQAELNQMAACHAHGFPHLGIKPLRSDVLSVVGFGPTLAETWPLIEHPAITTSGAHDFLIERGFVPDWHTQCDGRDHQVAFLEHPHAGVEYLMASVCHPKIWDLLRGHRVRVWHQTLGRHAIDWVGEHDPGGIVIAGGSNVGLAAIHLGGMLGFRRFKLFGMDGNWQNGSRHVGPHPDPVAQKRIARRAAERVWTTSPQMSNACDELCWLLRNHPELVVTVLGDSLQAAVLKDWLATQPFWSRTWPHADAGWLVDLPRFMARAQARAAGARRPTGSITGEAAIALHALCRRYRPRVVVEVGTYIGTSTMALRATDMLYTCDRENDCLPPAPRVTPHPFTGSFQMLSWLVDEKVRADMYFFDGRLAPGDVPLVLRTARPDAILVFDDVTGEEKGVHNLRLLRQWFPDHLLVDAPQNTTLAALVPRELIGEAA